MMMEDFPSMIIFNFFIALQFSLYICFYLIRIIPKHDLFNCKRSYFSDLFLSMLVYGKANE